MSTAHLLFGDDHSIGADLGWLWIHEQRWTGWQLRQLTATPPGIGVSVPHDRSVAHPDPGDPTRTPFAEAGFAGHQRLVAEADPRVALIDTAADLVVVGSTGHRFGPDRLGSTAEWILRHGAAPTVTARNGSRVRRVLVCADGSAPAQRAVEAAARLPWIGDTAVSAVVVDDGSVDRDAALASVHEALDAHVGTIDEIFDAGEPTPLILDAARQTGADLLVLGTRGRTGLERLLLGSTAAAVARHAHASVLSSR